MTNQEERYWANNSHYVTRNSTFDHVLGVRAWKQILQPIQREIKSVLDCGANIGRNIGFLKDSSLLPEAEFAAIDLNKAALDVLATKFPDAKLYNSSLLNIDLEAKFDLVFTSGVLIHINPENLARVFDNLMTFSNRYLILIEYFNRTPVEIPYHGQSGLLWKRDFGKDFLEYSNWKVVSYGFLWGQEFDNCGFDDCNYWVFERN
jgi:pseudaminic acid biosynthesis-associated methylase